MDYDNDPMREVERDNLAAEAERERRESEERVGYESKVETHIFQFVNIYEYTLACVCGRHILKPINKPKQNALSMWQGIERAVQKGQCNGIRDAQTIQCRSAGVNADSRHKHARPRSLCPESSDSRKRKAPCLDMGRGAGRGRGQ